MLTEILFWEKVKWRWRNSRSSSRNPSAAVHEAIAAAYIARDLGFCDVMAPLSQQLPSDASSNRRVYWTAPAVVRIMVTQAASSQRQECRARGQRPASLVPELASVDARSVVAYRGARILFHSALGSCALGARLLRDIM